MIEKGATLWHQLTWSHYRELLSLKNIDIIKYYINQIEIYNWSKRELISRIKSKEYERLDDKTKNKLINTDNVEILDLVKNPIIINNKYNITDIKENVLKKIVLEDIPSFLQELGYGFSFIDSEYKIKICNTYNYIDILLFNYIYNCFKDNKYIIEYSSDKRIISRVYELVGGKI